MVTVEDLLMAYASAYDAWLDPEAERKNPTPEYAELIRQAVSFENAKLRDLCAEMYRFARLFDANKHIEGMRVTDERREDWERRMRDLGIEVVS